MKGSSGIILKEETSVFSRLVRYRDPHPVPGGIEYVVIRQILNLENRFRVPAPLPGCIVYWKNA